MFHEFGIALKIHPHIPEGHPESDRLKGDGVQLSIEAN